MEAYLRHAGSLGDATPRWDVFLLLKVQTYAKCKIPSVVGSSNMYAYLRVYELHMYVCIAT